MKQLRWMPSKIRNMVLKKVALLCFGFLAVGSDGLCSGNWPALSGAFLLSGQCIRKLRGLRTGLVSVVLPSNLGQGLRV